MITMLVLAGLGGLLRAHFKDDDDGEVAAAPRSEPWLARWAGRG